MAACSIAIALGVMGAFTLVRGLMFRRHFRRHGPWETAACGPSFAGRWDARVRHDWRGRRGGGIGRSLWLRHVFARLDTTPGQEREIRSAIEDLREQARDARAGAKDAREDLANAVRGDSFDDAAFGKAESRADATIAQMKGAFAAALQRIHAVLDPHQRERLADLLAKGPGFRSRGGTPYRDGPT